MPAVYFRFESGFVASLRCIPMCVRFKLDLAGVKLKLPEWSRMDVAEREYLAEMPCGTAPEIIAFRDFLSLLVRINSGALPTLMDPAEPAWEVPRLPEQVREKARSLGIELREDAWGGLDPLRRFALLKLSRPGHEGKNFLPALEEFGMAAGGNPAAARVPSPGLSGPESARPA